VKLHKAPWPPACVAWLVATFKLTATDICMELDKLFHDRAMTTLQAQERSIFAQRIISLFGVPAAAVRDCKSDEMLNIYATSDLFATDRSHDVHLRT
jgi:hypothetical protein